MGWMDRKGTNQPRKGIHRIVLYMRICLVDSSFCSTQSVASLVLLFHHGDAQPIRCVVLRCVVLVHSRTHIFPLSHTCECPFTSQSPVDLVKSGGYRHMGATFGPAPLGSQIVSKVYYADNDLCDPNNPDVNRGGYPTRPADENGEMMRWTSPFVLMVNRSGTSSAFKS